MVGELFRQLGSQPPKCVLHAWAGAVQEEEPSRLHVRDGGKQVKQLLLPLLERSQLASHELRGANGQTQDTQPSLVCKPCGVPQPGMRAQLSNAGWLDAAGIPDLGFADVEADAHRRFQHVGQAGMQPHVRAGWAVTYMSSRKARTRSSGRSSAAKER